MPEKVSATDWLTTRVSGYCRKRITNVAAGKVCIAKELAIDLPIKLHSIEPCLMFQFRSLLNRKLMRPCSRRD